MDIGGLNSLIWDEASHEDVEGKFNWLLVAL